jgi:hypothetical protein
MCVRQPGTLLLLFDFHFISCKRSIACVADSTPINRQVESDFKKHHKKKVKLPYSRIFSRVNMCHS